ncbi:MAG: BTAD domain-containing putative transcriptional regulator [Desulfotomaculales bacterium]
MQPLNLLRSKLAVPQVEADFFPRPKLIKKLEEIPAYPVTVVQAGAGYGKTTAVAQYLPLGRVPVCWYTPGPEDASPYVFSWYLAGALASFLPGLKERFESVLGAAEFPGWEKTLGALLFALEEGARKAAGGCVLVVDDWHLMERERDVAAFFDRFLACKPGWLRLVVLSREKVSLPEISRLGVKGERLLIEEKDLAFSAGEVYDYLAKVSGARVTREDAKSIYRYSEGWVIALKLIGKVYRGPGFSLETLENGNLDALFDFLAQEVLARQEADMQSFLLKSSVLDYVSLPACAAVMGAEFSPQMVYRAAAKGLFLSRLDDHLFRYHYLFRNFLRREARKRLPDWEVLQCRAGYFYLQEGQDEEALGYLLRGKQWADAARVLERLGKPLVNSGRSQLFRSYFQELPAEHRKRPEFYVVLGEAERLASSYREALQYYREAQELAAALGDRRGLAAALRGTGEVYVDTIQPELAGDFLRRAYRSLGEEDAQEKAEILSLLAENYLNQGRPRQAGRYQRLAGEMFHLASRGNLEARLLLRTGRLEAAIRLLESRAPHQNDSYYTPASFRETPLLLSLCYSFVGEAEKAILAAQEGIRLGQKLRSPFVEAVGYARLGHALLIREGRPAPSVLEAYRAAMDLNDRLGVVRGRTEVLMGQCLFYGLCRDWLAAKRCGTEGVEVTGRLKDRWFSAVLLHCLGVAATNCRRFDEAKDYLEKAREMFSACGDSFGKAVASWWLACNALKTGESEIFSREAASLLELCESRGYDFLFARGTLLGPPDGRVSIPLLQEARRREIASAYVDLLLSRLGAGLAPVLPEYTLKVYTLGKFRVFRGAEEIEFGAWRRESARRLFLLLLTKRHRLLHKEEIMACLWPEAEPEAALRDFKVALNALLNVLEPGRQPRNPSFFIQRDGPAYYFNLASGYWLDAEEFESLVARAGKMAADRPEQAELELKRALDLYAGDYLQGLLQDEWCLEERERLAVLCIRATELLARLLFRRGDYRGCLQLAEKILEKDCCWEEAYRLQMLCHGKLGNRAMVVRTYQKCAGMLKKELGVLPSARTSGLYEKLAQKLG